MTGTLINIQILQAERKALKEALKKYGHHTSFCHVNTPGVRFPLGGEAVICDCGWSELQGQL